MKYTQEELQRRAQHALNNRGSGRWQWLVLRLMLAFPGATPSKIETKIEALARGEKVE